MVIEKPNIQCNDIGNEIATGCLDFFLFFFFCFLDTINKSLQGVRVSLIIQRLSGLLHSLYQNYLSIFAQYLSGLQRQRKITDITEQLLKQYIKRYFIIEIGELYITKPNRVPNGRYTAGIKYIYLYSIVRFLRNVCWVKTREEVFFNRHQWQVFSLMLQIPVSGSMPSL